MLDHLKADLGNRIVQVETEDKESQRDYETFISDSTEKRARDQKMIADKEAEKAEIELKLQEDLEALKSEKTADQANKEELVALHKECDWILKNYDIRKEARASEVDALNKGKAVLSGADFSL